MCNGAKMNFLATKQKIIKTDELLRMYAITKKQLDELKELYKFSKLKSKDTSSELTKLSLENNRHQHNYSTVLREHEALKAKYETLDSEYRLLEKKYGEQLIDHQLKIQEAQSNTGKELEISALKLKNGECNRKITKLSLENSKLKHKCDELSAQLLTKQNSGTGKGEQQNVAVTDIGNDKKVLIHSVVTLDSSKYKARLDEQEAALVKKDCEIQTYKTREIESNKRIACLTLEISKLRATLNDQLKELACNKEQSHEESDVVKMQTECNRKQMVEIAKLKQKCDELSGKLIEKELEHTIRDSKPSMKCVEIEEELVKRDNEIRKLKTKEDECNRRITNLSLEVSKLRQDCDSKVNGRMVEEIAELHKQNNHLQQQYNNAINRKQVQHLNKHCQTVKIDVASKEVNIQTDELDECCVHHMLFNIRPPELITPLSPDHPENTVTKGTPQHKQTRRPNRRKMLLSKFHNYNEFKIRNLYLKKSRRRAVMSKSDVILDAMLALKECNMNFTISNMNNESQKRLGNNCDCGHVKTESKVHSFKRLRCSVTNCRSHSYMLLAREGGSEELLGFFDVKKEAEGCPRKTLGNVESRAFTVVKTFDDEPLNVDDFDGDMDRPSTPVQLVTDSSMETQDTYNPETTRGKIKDVKKLNVKTQNLCDIRYKKLLNKFKSKSRMNRVVTSSPVAEATTTERTSLKRLTTSVDEGMSPKLRKTGTLRIAPLMDQETGDKITDVLSNVKLRPQQPYPIIPPCSLPESTTKRIMHKTKVTPLMDQETCDKITDVSSKSRRMHKNKVTPSIGQETSDKVTEILNLMNSNVKIISRPENVKKLCKSSPKESSSLDVVPEFNDAPLSPEPESTADAVENHCPVIIPLEKPNKMQSSEADKWFRRLFTFPWDDAVVGEVLQKFLTQDSLYVAQLILEVVTRDKPEIKTQTIRKPNAPLLSEFQMTLLGFMVQFDKLSKDSVCEHFLNQAELTLFLRTTVLAEAVTISRMYMAVCKLRKDLNRVRKFCCEVFFFMHELAIPIFFMVLTSWTEVLPHAINSKDYPIARVLVYLVHSIECKSPGYNLLPLKQLLSVFYGYSNDPENVNELFNQMFDLYIHNPVRGYSLHLLLLLKKQSDEWVLGKVDSHFKPLVHKITNDNYKATVLVFLGKIFKQFKNVDLLNETRLWLTSLTEDCQQSNVLTQAVDYCLRHFPVMKRINKKD